MYSTISLLALLLPSISAFKLVMNNTDESTFWEAIYANGTGGDEIGSLYQGLIFEDDTKKRVGTQHGFQFAFNESYNDNNVMFLEGGEIISMDDYIVSGTGEYKSYEGGHFRWNILQDYPFVAEVEVFDTTWNSSEGDESAVPDVYSMTSNLTSGEYTSIVNGGEEIGFTFQRNLTAESGDVVGIVQGYAYYFLPDPFVESLGYTPGPEMGNRRFIFENGNISVFNNIVVVATGAYSKFSGTVLNEMLLNDPTLAEITLSVAEVESETTDASQLYTPSASSSYDFQIKAGVNGTHDPILGADGKVIGQRFQNPVFDPEGKRVGSNAGYCFHFPEDNYTRSFPYPQGNVIVYLEGGMLQLFDTYVVHATGRFRAYKGGHSDINVTSVDPLEAYVTLVLPEQNATLVVPESEEPSVPEEPMEEAVTKKGVDSGSSSSQVLQAGLVSAMSLLVILALF